MERKYCEESWPNNGGLNPKRKRVWSHRLKSTTIDRLNRMRLTQFMGQLAPLAITVHDFMDIPEGPPYYELVEGELFISPLPILFHQGIAGNIVRVIYRYL